MLCSELPASAPVIFELPRNSTSSGSSRSFRRKTVEAVGFDDLRLALHAHAALEAHEPLEPGVGR